MDVLVLTFLKGLAVILLANYIVYKVREAWRRHQTVRRIKELDAL